MKLTKPFLRDLLVYVLIIIIAAAVVLTSGITRESFAMPSRDVGFERARVLGIVGENLNEDRVVPGMMIGYQDVELLILTGPYQGQMFTIRNPLGRSYNTLVQEEMEVVVSIFDDREGISVRIYSYKRNHFIWWLAALFILCLLAVGRIKGLKSLAALVFTGIMLLFLMVPRILAGHSPIITAIITAALAVTASFYILSGWAKKTLGAILGTVAGVVIAGTLSYTVGRMAHLSGITMENAEQLLLIADHTGLQVRGLMFAAILIASLGAIMDVGMSISSAATELHLVNPRLTARELFAAAMNVGTDIIGTMANTLILAFAGGMLNLIIVMTSYNVSYMQFSNMDIIVIEVIQALAGSIGIVLTVPITAVIAVILLKYPSFAKVNLGRDV